MSRSLVEYSRRRKRTLYAIGVAAGLPSGQIYRIAQGDRGCSDEVKERIRIATDGEVTPGDIAKVRIAWLKANPDAQKKSVRDEAAA